MRHPRDTSPSQRGTRIAALSDLDPGIAYGPAVSVESLLVPIVGGMGTLFGPLLGAVALHAVSEVTREVIGDLPGISLVIYGTILVIMVLFAPRGLSGLVSRLTARMRRTAEGVGQ